MNDFIKNQKLEVRYKYETDPEFRKWFDENEVPKLKMQKEYQIAVMKATYEFEEKIIRIFACIMAGVLTWQVMNILSIMS